MFRVVLWIIQKIHDTGRQGDSETVRYTSLRDMQLRLRQGGQIARLVNNDSDFMTPWHCETLRLLDLRLTD